MDRNLLRLDYIRRRAWRWIALALTFVLIWYACFSIGVVILENTTPGDI